MNKELQAKVSTCIGIYKQVYKQEYDQFLIEKKQLMSTINNKWSALPGTDYIVRELNRYPETLATIIKRTLTDDEHKEFREEKFQIWFGNNNKEFNMARGGKL